MLNLNFNFDTRPATWQRRALRYLAIYLTLSISLVAIRYITKDIRPSLREVQKQEAALQSEKDDLRIQVQVATSPQKIQNWAYSSGMQGFAVSSKSTRELGEEKEQALNNKSTLEVITKWK